MIRDLQLEAGQLAAAQVSAPKASEPDLPTIEFKARLNDRQSMGATVSVAVAAELVAALQAALCEATGDEIVTINGNQYVVGEWDLREPGQEPDDDWTYTLYATRVPDSSLNEEG